MKRLALFMVMLAAVVAVSSCTADEDQDEGAPSPGALARIRYHEPSHGWTAVPTGWASSEIGPQFVRARSPSDPTRLVLWTYRDRSAGDALAAFRLIAGIGEAAPSGNRSRNRLLWTRHSARGAEANVTVELAVAADGADAHLAALFARRDEVDRLVETVLLPALDSFVPGPPDAVASILASSPPDPDYWPTDGWRRASAASQGMDGALLDRLVTLIRATALPIDSVTVVRHGYVVLDVSFPPFAARELGEPYAVGELHELHSATKSVTSALVGIALADPNARGVRVDTPVIRLLAPSRPALADARKRAITLEHLLTMTAGLAWKEWGHAYEPGTGNDLVTMIETAPTSWTQYVLDRPMAAQPGATYLYSSGASHVLSAILSMLTGRPAAEFATERLFGPLGIEDFLWPASPEGATVGFAALALRPQDLAKLAFLYLHRGSWDRRTVVPAAWVERSTTDGVADPIYEYGYQWWLDRADGYAYMAGRFGQLAFVAPDADLVAVLTAHLPENMSQGVPRWLFERYVLPAAERG